MTESPALDKLDALGIEAFCDLILDGTTQMQIAENLGISRSMVNRWLSLRPEHSARALEARRLASSAWDEKAEKVIQDAGDQFELSKAKELAHHYRWRASKVHPADYGIKPAIISEGEDENKLVIVNSPDAD